MTASPSPEQSPLPVEVSLVEPVPPSPSPYSAPPPPAPMQPPPSLARRLTGRNGSRLMVALLALWIIVVSFSAQLTAWVQAGFSPDAGNPTPWVVASLVQVALIGLPTLIFALRWRLVRYRAIFQCWAWATGYLLLLVPSRLFVPVESQVAILAQVVLTVLYWLMLRSRLQEKPPLPRAGIALALLVGSVAALPWLYWGALGSPLDVLLNGVLAVAFGLLVWTILQLTWIPAQRREPRQPRRDRLVSGLVTGVMLLILASALSFNGVQLLLMIMLPALGWAVVAAGAPALATALVTAAPLLLIDSDPMTIAATDPLLGYYFFAAFLTMMIGWLLGVLALIPQPDPAKAMARPVAWVCAGVALALAGLVYVQAGNPGFYGDRLFVVLRDQADLGALASAPTLEERRKLVYETLVNEADTSQSDLRASLDRLAWLGIEYQPYYLVNAVEVNGGLLMRLWLQSRADVAEIMVSPHLRPTAPLNLPAEEFVSAPSETQWNLTQIGADRVWHELGVNGAGIVVGQSDSGVQGEHPEFADRYRGRTSGDNYNWLDPWNNSPSPNDAGGHGTHTLGSILGNSVGVAPGATWFACANLSRNLGNPAYYLACMQFMLAPYPQGGDALHDGDPSRAADVLNNSWGCPTNIEGCAPDVFAPAVDALTQAGIFVVVSAGNDGPQCSTIATPPAIYEPVLAVGATDEEGELANFSSVGPVTVDGSGRIKPDVLAPGVDVLSAWPDNKYTEVSGTSMAGPHLVGTVALMWSASPALRGDVARTKEIIEQTAHPFHGTLEGDGSEAPSQEQNHSQETEDDSARGAAIGNVVENALRGGGESCLAQTDLSAVPNNAAGYGFVDAYAAVEAAQAVK